MKEFSLFIKDRINLTPQEFYVINQNTVAGRFWKVYEQQSVVCKFTRQELILNEQAFLFFRLVSSNIYVWWETQETKCLSPNQTYQINDRIKIRPLN